MKILLLLVCLVIQETIGGHLRRVVGGYDVDIVDVPYHVSVRYEKNIHVCGGALISLRHVLTAAHCVVELFEPPYDQITVVTGTNSLQNGGTHHKVKNIEWHDKFADGPKTPRNDVAVLTLTADVEENEKQKPIKLPIGEPRMNVTGIICGFGRTAAENPYPANILQGLTTRILPSGACKKFKNKYEIHEEHVCGLQEKGTGFCKGDSGGALVYDGRIVGLSSWTAECGGGYPDVYVNVYRYLKFIKDAMKV